MKLSFEDWRKSPDGRVALLKALESAKDMDDYAVNMMRTAWEAALAAGTEPACEHGQTGPHEAHIGYGGHPNFARSLYCPGPKPTRAEAMHAGTITGPEPEIIDGWIIEKCEVPPRGDWCATHSKPAGHKQRVRPAQQAPAATGLPCPICFSPEACQHFEACAPAATGDDALADRFYDKMGHGETMVVVTGAECARISRSLRARPLPTRERLIETLDKNMQLEDHYDYDHYGCDACTANLADKVLALFAPIEAKP